MKKFVFAVALLVALPLVASAQTGVKKPIPAKVASASKTVSLKLSGMKCEGCSMKVRDALRDVPGVKDVTVDAKTQTAVLIVDKAKAAPNEKTIRSTVEGAGHFKVVSINNKTANVVTTKKAADCEMCEKPADKKK